jgi:3-oxoacyl-[acyl-carrier-protein] synthase-3
MESPRALIAGVGAALPERVMTNADLERLVDTSDEWITTRTGIKQRHIAEESEYLSQYATRASLQALERAGVDPSELDLIVLGTVTPDMPIPATACFVQEQLGARQACAFDIQAGCSGFIYGLSVANQFIKTGAVRHALVIGAELLSNFLDWEDRTTCVIFADGAGAAVLSAGKGPRGVLATRMRSDGSMADFIMIPGGGTRAPASVATVQERMHYIKMRGNETFKIAVRSIEEISRETIVRAGLRPEDIDLYVPHQANRRIINAVARRLGLEPEQCLINIDRVGNTSAASIPIALSEAVDQGRLKEGDTVLLAAFGAGLTWAAALATW